MKSITALTELIKEKQAELASVDIDPDDYEDSYCESLDSKGPVYVGSIAFDPSRILQELDPIAYRCGLVDYIDGINIEDTAEYKDLTEEIEELESELEELEELEEEVDEPRIAK